MTLPLAAQTGFARHSISLGLGAGVPLGRETIGSSAPSVRLAYGLRLHRNFQADAALDALVGSFEACCYSHETRYATAGFLLPSFGGRLVIPTGRADWFAGGGAVRSHYTDPLVNYALLHGSWGGYGAAGASVRLRRSGRLRAGVSARYYNVRASIEDIGGRYTFSLQHRWIVTTGDFTFGW